MVVLNPDPDDAFGADCGSRGSGSRLYCVWLACPSLAIRISVAAYWKVMYHSPSTAAEATRPHVCLRFKGDHSCTETVSKMNGKVNGWTHPCVACSSRPDVHGPARTSYPTYPAPTP